MASYLFPALLLLFSVVSCALCGAGSADPANMSVELFKQGWIDVLKPRGGSKERLDIEYVFSPSIIGISDVMIALVEVQKADDTYEILTKYIVTEGDDWSDRAIEDNGKNWKAQWAWKGDKPWSVSFASVARGDHVYILSAAKAPFTPPSSQKPDNPKAWDFQLTVGTITDSADASGKKIEWNTEDVPDRFVSEIQDKLQDVFPFDGSAFLMDDGTLVFVVRAWNRTSDKFVFVIAHSKEPSSDFAFTYVETTADCYSNFFLWGEQLFMVPRYCHGGNGSEDKLQVSNDTGETWRGATGPLAEKLDNLTKGRDSFTRITTEGRRVLLFIEETSDSGASQVNVNISLFMADENHVEEVGLILSNVTIFYDGSFVYTNDELFFLRVQYGDFNTIFMRLKEQLGKIKRLLSTWYRDDS